MRRAIKCLFIFTGFLFLQAAAIFPLAAEETSFMGLEKMNEDLNSKHTQFGLKLYSEMARQTPGKNLVFSPSGLETLLSLLYSAASDNTKNEIGKVLEVDQLPLEDLNKGTALWASYTETFSRDIEFTVANSFWVRRGVVFKPQFLDQNHKFYRVDVNVLEALDEEAVTRVNEWAYLKTDGRIEKITDTLGADENFFLTQAVYLGGNWKTPFESAGDDNFTRADGNTVKTRMVQTSVPFDYYKGDSFRMVAFPYADKRLKLMVVLPGNKQSLESFREGLTREKLEKWISKLTLKEGRVQLPDLKLECEMEMSEPLKKIGMISAFENGNAHFSEMIKEKNVSVFLSRVRHKAVMELNAEGGVNPGGNVKAKKRKRFEIKFDHPFFFFVRDEQSGSILLMGQVENPE